LHRPLTCRDYGERVKWWKVVGLAGVAGVAATGVVIARRERQRRMMTPDQVRSRLHRRYAEIGPDGRHAAGVIDVTD
jgi:hypothetical protein